MSRSTQIEWTEHTWNPFVGCSIKSEGCKNCYAMWQAARIESFKSAAHYIGLTEKVNGRIVWTGKLARASDATMRKPFSLPRGDMVFVNSMSDFWHPVALDEWRIEAIEVMRKNPDLVFQVLTKRPDEAIKFLERRPNFRFPDNFWFGVTVESGKTKGRIDTLRRIPASMRFISFEPLLDDCGELDLTGIHWVITGGESGVVRRPCKYEWVKRIDDQAVEQEVARFFKQWGHWTNNPLVSLAPAGVSANKFVAQHDPRGKGGSLLDGQYVKEYPVLPALKNQADVFDLCA